MHQIKFNFVLKDTINHARVQFNENGFTITSLNGYRKKSQISSIFDEQQKKNALINFRIKNETNYSTLYWWNLRNKY